MAGRCFRRSEKLLEENEPTADIPRRSPASWGGFSQQKRPPLLSSRLCFFSKFREVSPLCEISGKRYGLGKKMLRNSKEPREMLFL